MKERNGVLYIWWKISDEEFDYYSNKYEYLGVGYYNEGDFSAMSLKFKVGN